MKPATKASLLLLSIAALFFGAEKYQKPPKAVLDVLNAPVTPMLSLSPTRNFAVQAQPVRYPPIAELSQPMLRIAGMRINPKSNGLHNTVFNSSLTLRKVPEGTEIKVELPPNGRYSGAHWSADGLHYAFTNSTNSGVELWIGDTTGKAHKVEGVRINAVLAGGVGGGGGRGGAPVSNDVQWMPDNKTLLVEMVKPNRGPAPVEGAAPNGPHVQESLGGGAPEVTHEDMLQNPHDEDLFVYYATSQLATVDSETGKATPVGKPGIVASVRVSPNGKDLLVTTLHKPFSYLHAASAFPKDIEVWDLTGKVVQKVAWLPLEDKVPINGVMTGPRMVQWRPSEPATLLWVEALDKGDIKNQAPFRDRIVTLKAPFIGDPKEVFKTEQRFGGIQMAAKGGLALVEDSERKTRRVRTFQIDLDKPEAEAKLIWSRNQQDRYKDPGSPVTKTLPNGRRVLVQDGDNIFLSGIGCVAGGRSSVPGPFQPGPRKPASACSSATTIITRPSYRCSTTRAPVPTRRESPTEPPNYFVRRPGSGAVAVTRYPDPQPSIRGIHKELVKYKRNDGVELSFTLYLPPDYKAGTKLPTLVWAYPYEFNDADTASQVSGSTKRFTEMTGYSQLFFVLDGFAVLDNAAMPVVGDPDVVNDHYLDQIIVDAKAAIDKAVEMGVTDPARVGVGGHSYGGFHDRKPAGALRPLQGGNRGKRSGQSHPDAVRIPERTPHPVAGSGHLPEDVPLHVRRQNQSPAAIDPRRGRRQHGTWPIQSQRMYEAVRGNGGTVRLVFLPSKPTATGARKPSNMSSGRNSSGSIST